jgi:transmembrane sensor
MADGAPDMKDLFAPVKPSWGAARADRVQRSVHRKLRQRARVRAVAAVGGLVLVAGAAALMLRTRELPLAEAPATTRFEDGSSVRLLDLRSEVRTVESTPLRRVVRLVRGGAAFEITPSAVRTFRVEAGDVAVEVLGTVFSVEKVGARTRVGVTRGRVRVAWNGGQALLSAGQSDLFPPASEEPPAAAVPPPAAAPTAMPTPAPPAPRAWRALAQRGRFDDAYRALRREGPAAVPDEPGALLLAADVARLSHHPAQAVAPLRHVLDRYDRDPRAGLAAFTLGLVLLEELGRPRDAAAAFARSRGIDPGGDLAEDALAREVEAHFRAGDATRARQAAEEYLRRYPNGRRLRAVRTFGQVE